MLAVAIITVAVQPIDMAIGDGGGANADLIQIGSMLIALGMISAGALGLLGILPPSPLVIAILLVVVVLLSFSLGKRWEELRVREETGAEYERA